MTTFASAGVFLHAQRYCFIIGLLAGLYDDTYFRALVQDEWRRADVLPPGVITVSYGPTGLLVP